MTPKRALLICAALTLAVAAWWGYATVRQSLAVAASVCNCEDDGIGRWRFVLWQYAEAHAGSLPSPGEREKLAAEEKARSFPKALTCNLGAPYEWSARQLRVTPAGRAVPLAWCGQPHGFTRQWRNVLYTDLTTHQVPEAEFLRWSSEW